MNEAAPAAPEPCGSWPSPIDAASVAAASIRFGQTAIRDGAIFWTESRPAEAGRSVLVRATAGDETADLTPPPFNVRTRAHEYGGGAFVLLDDHGLAFCDDADQQVHLLAPGRPTRRLTELPAQRFADLCHDRRRGRLLAVREDHREGDIDAVATIVAIDLASGAQRVIAEGHDFFSNPTLSPDGSRLAWLSWDHPDMPWDATTLWLATVGADGSLGEPRRIAGGGSESVFQPSWSSSGELHFVADRSGWWNLHRLRDDAVEPLWPMAAEFGEPQWVFGMSTYGFDGRGRIVCSFLQDAWSTL
ncbi:MAG TPA: S9 family peptidase, partial [Caldimonas sp.]|nr:S9 family peptidase [Caldimonas sp.]